tara:strand:- start:2493 stop:4232 length:1740 start_codon:yes stop_codon:yes gene_type:complete
MGASADLLVECETATDVWTDLTPDLMATEGLEISYGISGDKPLDTVAGTGQCGFSLLGLKYSFHHADALSGFVLGAGIRVILYRTSVTAQGVASVTRSSSTATVTTSASHGYSTGDWITIAGASPSGYNGTFQITKTAATTFTYSLSSLTPSTPASGTITARLGYIKHWGKLRSADPNPGAYRVHLVRVTSLDRMRDLAETKVRAIAVAVDKTEAELLTLMLDSLPAVAQPLRRSFATGVDTYPYAFNGLGAGQVALSIVKSIAVSAFAAVYMKGDGTLVLQSRTTRSTGTPAYHFDESMMALSTAQSVDELVNNVRTVIHPRTIDSAATTVIASTTGTPLSLEAGATLTVYLDYRDPSDTKTLIGGTAVVNATATTDYLGNAVIAGSGTNLTSSLSVTTTAYASTAKLVIVNNHATDTIFIVNGSGVSFLQLRGKGIYQEASQSFEAASSQPYGDKAITIDLKYQNSPSIAVDYGVLVESRYNDQAAASLQSITYQANDSDDLLLQSVALEPGDVIQVSESATGADAIDMVIQSVRLGISEGPWITCTYGLAPAVLTATWILGDATRSKLGETTYLGF